MKPTNFTFKYFIFFMTLVSILILNTKTLADPIEPYDAQNFALKTHSFHKVPPNESVITHFEKKIARLEKIAAKTPENIRDLADAYHMAGHLQEGEHNFERAIEYHKKSLPLYEINELPITGSWDGVEHFHEHMFLNLLDWGIIEGRNGRTAKAMNLFQQAYEYSQKPELQDLLQKRVSLMRYVSMYYVIIHLFAPEKQEDLEKLLKDKYELGATDFEEFKKSEALAIWDQATGSALRCHRLLKQ